MFKLLKYHLASFSKTHIITSIFVLVSAILRFILVLVTKSIDVTNENSIRIITILNGLDAIAKLFFNVSLLVLLGFTFVLTIIKFKGKVLGDEGYLTHTLPVSKGAIVGSIYLNALIYLILDLIVILVAFIFYNSFDLSFISNFFRSMDGNQFKYIVYIVVIVFSLYFTYLGYFTACLAIGYSKSANKIKNTIIAGIILYAIQQVIMSVAVVILFTVGLSMQDFSNLGDFILIVVSLLYIGQAVVLYLITWIFTSKKLNLE